MWPPLRQALASACPFADLLQEGSGPKSWAKLPGREMAGCSRRPTCAARTPAGPTHRHGDTGRNGRLLISLSAQISLVTNRGHIKGVSRREQLKAHRLVLDGRPSRLWGVCDIEF